MTGSKTSKSRAVLSSFLVMTRSRVLPLLWVGAQTCCFKLKASSRRRNRFADRSLASFTCKLNFNQPSLRITPSSPMQGLSFINWLFFGIGFLELKAASSLRKASHSATRSISSSASFISSSNSSILAFLLSLLRMLCSTLLTLASTQTKRIQLEYRFGSISFRRLHVIRVAQTFVSSFLFEVLISGILLGLSGTFIFDHSLK